MPECSCCSSSDSASSLLREQQQQQQHILSVVAISDAYVWKLVLFRFWPRPVTAGIGDTVQLLCTLIRMVAAGALQVSDWSAAALWAEVT
jgi:hypothetical protein